MDGDCRAGIPRIEGRVVKWFNNPPEDIHVKVVLNQFDEKAREGNKGKSDPIMLSEVKRIDKTDAGISPYVVLLEEGSHIEFRIKGKGPCGYGYKISTGHEKIVEALYQIDYAGANDYITSHLRRYQSKAKTIMVDSFETMGIEGSAEKMRYMFCNIKGWEVKSCMNDGMQYPRPKKECAFVKADVKGGAVHEGEDSESTFGSGLSNVEKGESIGSLRLQFLIFADQKARDQFYKSYLDLDVDDF